MIIFLNTDGTCEKIAPERIFQGSNNVDDIIVIAPFPSTTAMQIGFILPNGLYWQSSENARYAPMTFVEQGAIGGVNVWRYDLPNALTQQQGVLYIAINAVSAQDNRTSFLCEQTIEESVLPELPDAPSKSVYDLIQLYISRLQASTENVPNLVKGIQKVAPNAIAYTRNDGVTSAEIVIESSDTAPIPVNAASTIVIPKAAWQPVYDASSPTTVTGYKIVIDAAMHGQMRDGATASDLWVSFDETENGVTSGAYQGYTVSDSGDISIVVNQPVDMTLRVWNGKGLVDEVARDMVESETERAESEEESLQKQITELQNSGVDVLARAQIAEETERAEAAEQTLQEQIAAERNRAIEAERVLTSDVEGLREDVNNESHFRGMFDSVEALRATVPAATPNDYAYIVGGNQWIYQNGAWTDSKVPSPNTAVPASKVTPLMDGVASAGTSSEFARGDHRHPGDTTKANVDGDYPDMTVGKATHADSADTANKLGEENVGSMSVPMFLSRGVPTACRRTIPLVTLNDEIETAPSFYAPTEAGASGNMLIQGNNAPEFRGAGSYKNGVATNHTDIADYVKNYYCSSDGSSWYRVWASGWKECGGVVKVSYGVNTTVGYPVEFKSKVCALTTTYLTSQGRGEAQTVIASSVSAVISGLTSFVTKNQAGSDFVGISFYACGY